MAKLTAWLVALAGVLLLPPVKVLIAADTFDWLIAAIVLIVGIGKLMRNYQKKKRR